MEEQKLKSRLNAADFVILKRIVNWNKFSRLKEEFINRIILVMGGVFVIVSIYNTFNNFDDKRIFYVTVPGIISGILFLWFYRSGANRIKEKKRLAEVLEKILEKDA